MTDQEHIFIPEESDIGKRVDKWLSENSELSRTRIRALIETGSLKVDGSVFDNPSGKVQADREYVINVPPPIESEPKGENIPLNITFEDDDLIVVHKPAGMTVHPAPGSPSGTLVNALLFHAKDSLSGIGGVLRPGIVHRIDKDTSGLLVVAKNDKAHQKLSRQFAKHTVERTYICFVRGRPTPKEGRIESRLARSPHNRKKQAVVKNTWQNSEASEHGRHAVTNYKYILGFGKLPKASLGTPRFSKIECKLETGRTHQIRVHLAHSGCPLIGDPLYGKHRGFKNAKDEGELAVQNFLSSFKRQALHAKSLGFIHPESGESLHFETDLPPDILELEKLLLGLPV